MKRIKKNDIKKQFTTSLLKWNKKKNIRQMPWKGEKNPYRIWLSEIILQQTRVEQGINYYHRILEAFPNIHLLAKAPDKKVYKLWEGLGYYTRCKNLLITAKYISDEKNGKFPDTYDEIKNLKGIGSYTAAAIASFAFNLPNAVIDGNVFRVLSRIFGITKAIDSTEGKKIFTELANELLDKKNPGIYNQAIMDFGAVICKPLSPDCSKCPFNKTCYAYTHNKINQLPVKNKKIKIKNRWFYYLVVEYKGQVAISQRREKDIWQQLFEFPLIEAAKAQSIKKILQQMEKKYFFKNIKYEILSISPVHKQQLSHQQINGRFIHIGLKQKSGFKTGWLWIKKKDLSVYAFPRFINQYLHKKSAK